MWGYMNLKISTIILKRDTFYGSKKNVHGLSIYFIVAILDFQIKFPKYLGFS